MKKPTRPNPSAPAPEPARTYPIARIEVGDLVDDLNEDQLLELLEGRMREAIEHYAADWAKLKQEREKQRFTTSYSNAAFRGRLLHAHPLWNGHWANDFNGTDGNVIKPQLQHALQAGDWQELMMCAGMLCVRDMLYGRAVEAKAQPKPAAKARPARKTKAVVKTARKKPAAKKPGLPLGQAAQAASRKAVKALTGAAPKPTAQGKLRDLVEQVRPFFKANPKLSREELIAKVGRGYERLVKFAELRNLCLAARRESDTVSAQELAAGAGPEAAAMRRALEAHPAKPKRERPRRDPPPPPAGTGIANLGSPSDIAQASTLLPANQADNAEKTLTAHFDAEGVSATFSAKSTEAGWTIGWLIGIAKDDDTGGYVIHVAPLRDDGPVEADPNAAIRNCVGDMLEIVKANQKRAEEGPEDDQEARVARAHTAELERLRAWLLGFQARGVEKIRHLQKAQQGEQRQMELAA